MICEHGQRKSAAGEQNNYGRAPLSDWWESSGVQHGWCVNTQFFKGGVGVPKSVVTEIDHLV